MASDASVCKVLVHYRQAMHWVSLPKGHGVVYHGDFQKKDVIWDHMKHGWFFVDPSLFGKPVGGHLVARSWRVYPSKEEKKQRQLARAFKPLISPSNLDSLAI